MPLALEGIRILDLSWQGPGPYCTMLLGDLGAEVIRVEEPGKSGRRAVASVVEADSEKALAYDAHGRNKRSVTLNLKSKAAREVFYELVRTADVVVEGFRPGVSSRLGVDYATLKEINRRIVYCSISGYGQTGPYRSLAGHDINYISIGGALGMIGQKGGPPSIPLNLIADYGGGGMHAIMGILSALFYRERKGTGQYIDVSLTDTVVSLISREIGVYLLSGAVPAPGDTMLSGSIPDYNVYETKDGKYISIGSLEPRLFAGLCQALGREDLIGDQNNLEKRDEIFAFFRETFKTKSRDEWFAYLREFDTCAGPVNSLDEVLTDPQVREREMIIEMDHPSLGNVKQVGISVKLSETPGAVQRFAPARGQHTDEILNSLGYAKGDIRALREQGAI